MPSLDREDYQTDGYLTCASKRFTVNSLIDFDATTVQSISSTNLPIFRATQDTGAAS